MISLVQRSFFACRKFEFPCDRRCGPDRYTCRAPHITCTVIAQYRRHVFLGSRSLRAQDEWCAQKNHSSTRHVSPCTSRNTEHQHKFSPTCLSCVAVVLCFCRPLLRTQTCCPRIHLPIVEIHGGPQSEEVEMDEGTKGSEPDADVQKLEESRQYGQQGGKTCCSC